MDKRHITISVEDALSWKDAAKELGITTMTLWRWEKNNLIIAIQLGQYKFIPLSEVERIKKAR